MWMARPHHPELFAVGALCIGIRRLHSFDYRPKSSLRIQIFRFTVPFLATSPVSCHFRQCTMEGNLRVPWIRDHQLDYTLDIHV
jgi:hypothetical protein